MQEQREIFRPLFQPKTKFGIHRRSVIFPKNSQHYSGILAKNVESSVSFLCAFFFHIPAQMKKPNLPQKQWNNILSYMKGVALFMIITIHLLDWTNMRAGIDFPLGVREFLYPAVFFFIALSGSVVYIAYKNRPLRESTKRLFLRAGQIFILYYLCNGLKFFLFQEEIFPLMLEPSYYQFVNEGTWNWEGILFLHSYSVPIGILLSIAFFLLLSPFLLWITQKIHFPRTAILILLGIVSSISFFIPLPASPVTDFLLAKNFVFLPPLLWFVPFLIGFFVAMMGFEKWKNEGLFFSAVGTVAIMYSLHNEGRALQPTWYMYPLQIYYVFISTFVFFVVIWILDYAAKYSFYGRKYFFGLLRFFGDHTLSVYILHWIVINISIYFFSPNIKILWKTVPIFLLLFLVFRWKKFQKAVRIEEEVSSQTPR